jgi:hypothetical protein
MKKYYYCIILAALLVASSSASAQENWGLSEDVCGIAGCTWSVSNPCFDQLGRACFEYNGRENSNYYNLCYNADSIYELPGDSINIDSFSNHSPFISYDKQRLYFSSDRPGGYGGYDIWVSSWQGNSWGIPVNVGLPINSAANEFGPSLPVTETSLYFCRATGGDEPWRQSSVMYKSEKAGGLWNEPVPLPEPLNSRLGECEPAISADGLKLYFSSHRGFTGHAILIYTSRYQDGNWSTPVPLNSNINHFQYCDFDSQLQCLNYSAAIDSAGTSMLLTSYFVCAIIDGQIMVSHLIDDINDRQMVPVEISAMAYPNPFNTQTSISFTLAQAGQANIDIYDIAGRLVEKVADRYYPAGRNSIVYNTSRLSTGIYFYKLNSINKSTIGKMTLIK